MTDTHDHGQQHDQGETLWALCRAEYERPGGRHHGDRIVRCNLAQGHDGDHEEDPGEPGGNTWPRAKPAPRQQHGDVRDAQIRAVRAFLDRYAAVPGRLIADVAAALVDAVTAQAGDAVGREWKPDTGRVTTADRQLVADATGGRIASREVQPEWAEDDEPGTLDLEPVAGDPLGLKRLSSTYKLWHREQLDATGVDHHRWWSDARRILADYLEAVGAGDAQNAADETETAGTTRTSGEAGTGGSGAGKPLTRGAEKPGQDGAGP